MSEVAIFKTNQINNSYLKCCTEQLKLFSDFLGNYLVVLSDNGKIAEINEHARKYFGWENISIIGQHFPTICKMKELASEMSQILIEQKTREPVHGFHRILQNDTLKFLKTKWLLFNLYDATDKINANVLIGKPATFSESQKQFDYWKNCLNAVADSIPGSVYWKDKEGKYLGCNETMLAKANLSKKEDIVGKTDYELWPAHASELQKNDNDVINLAKTIEKEEAVKIAAGDELWFASVKTPLKDEEGEIVGMVGNSLDITDQKRMEKELSKAKEAAEAANQAKNQFLENIRHDIRTPLSGIVAFAGLIGDEATDPEAVKEYSDNLIASGTALSSVLNEILDAIKISSGELPILKKKFDLHAQLDNLLQLYLAKAKAKKLDFKLDYDSNIPYLIGDPYRIYRIMLELIANALNYTDQGFVKISAILSRREKNDLLVKLIVQDSGLGISKKQQQEIYSQFERVEPTCKGLHKGLGLGLSIVKQFVEDLSGEIYIDSELKLGTTFSCIIPLTASLLNESEGAEQVPEVSIEKLTVHDFLANKKPLKSSDKSSSDFQILIVEDSTMAANAEEQILSKLGVKVDVAPDGKTALKFFNANNYDLIFMDIGLPDIDGYEVTKRIRLFEKGQDQHIPIVALSAHTDTEYKKHCVETGMDCVLNKPLSKIHAFDVLNAFVPKYRLKAQTQTKKKMSNKKAKEDLLKLSGEVIDITYMKEQLQYSDQAVEKFLKLIVPSISEDFPILQKAYKEQDWKIMEETAHKMKSGAMYGGALRLSDACYKMEKYLRGGNRELVSDLYQLISKEVNAVNNYIKNREKKAK